MRFIMLYSAIPRPLIETQRLYETGHNLRYHGMSLIPLSLLIAIIDCSTQLNMNFKVP